MIDKNIIRIINEEASNFDFLGNEDYLKGQEVIDLLQNEEIGRAHV